MVRIVAVYSEGIEEEQQAEEIERELMQERGLELVLAQVLERELGLAQELVLEQVQQAVGILLCFVIVAFVVVERQLGW